jgi:hypothetical protein
MRPLHPSIKRLPVAINRSRFLAVAEGAALGSAIGLIDIHSTNENGFNTSLAVLATAAAIGLRHGGRSWQAWSPLGWCFYLMHRAAIARGYRPPYVEEDANWAILSLYVLWPAGLGLALGAFIRIPISRLLRYLGWTKGETNSPVDPGAALSPRPDLAVAERRPRRRLTVGGWLIVIALFGLHLAALRALLIHEPSLGLGTTYSERYGEDRFTTLRVGMSRGEVEAIMGRPLRVVPWNQRMGPHDEEMWLYSDQPNALANFHRRWLLFEKGKVADVINEFWID